MEREEVYVMTAENRELMDILCDYYNLGIPHLRRTMFNDVFEKGLKIYLKKYILKEAIDKESSKDSAE